MRSLGDYNPIAVAVYFVTVSMIAAFCMNPILLFLSLSGAVALFAAQSRGRGIRTHLGFLGLFLLVALINPITSHNGVTVLFVINDAPITAEAFFPDFYSSSFYTKSVNESPLRKSSFDLFMQPFDF